MPTRRVGQRRRRRWYRKAGGRRPGSAADRSGAAGTVAGASWDSAPCVVLSSTSAHSPRALIRHTGKARNLGKNSAVGNPAEMRKTVPKGGYVLDLPPRTACRPVSGRKLELQDADPLGERAQPRGGTPALTLKQLAEQLTHGSGPSTGCWRVLSLHLRSDVPSAECRPVVRRDAWWKAVHRMTVAAPHHSTRTPSAVRPGTRSIGPADGRQPVPGDEADDGPTLTSRAAAAPAGPPGAGRCFDLVPTLARGPGLLHGGGLSVLPERSASRRAESLCRAR